MISHNRRQLNLQQTHVLDECQLYRTVG